MAEKKVYLYKARLANGTYVEGTVKSENESLVIEDFNKRNIAILEIQEQSLLNRDLNLFSKGIKPREVSQFMRQLATLTDAAIPLTRCLDVLKDQATNPSMREILTQVRSDIDVGSNLASALAKHPKAFTPLTIAMVRAGEAGGFLTPDVLENISVNLEQEISLKQQIRAALTYPVVVMSLIFLIVTGLLIFVVPSFAKTFNDLGAPLPVPTQILISLSNSMTQGPGLIVMAAVIGSIFYLYRRYKWNPKFRRVWEPIKYKMPVFGKLAKKTIIARFARNFSSLIDSGLPIMQVLDVVGETSGSIIIEDALKDVKKHVAIGEMISPQLRKYPIFPSLLTEMLSVGEEAGEIANMLEKIAISYDEEVKATAEALTSLIEPLLVVTLGIVVGGILVSLYLPMFSVYSAM